MVISLLESNMISMNFDEYTLPLVSTRNTSNVFFIEITYSHKCLFFHIYPWSFEYLFYICLFVYLSAYPSFITPYLSVTVFFLFHYFLCLSFAPVLKILLAMHSTDSLHWLVIVIMILNIISNAQNSNSKNTVKVMTHTDDERLS